MTASLRQAEGCLAISGVMTLETATTWLARGLAALEQGDLNCDLAAVTDVDSSGLAVLFGWQRAATAQSRQLHIDNPPHNLISLAEVYGVTGLLPLS